MPPALHPARGWDTYARVQPEPSLLLLVPAYNEEERIGPTLREFAAYFRDHYRGPFKLIVVLNGCRDNTLGVVRDVAKEYFWVGALEFKEPIGKGGALIEGLQLAPLADLIGYVDADGATSPEAYIKLVRLCTDTDCVIGSRWLPGAKLHQSQPWLRRFVSRCFHAIVEALFHMRIKDTQCPAKVIKRPAIEKVLPRLSAADLAFDVNLLYSLKRAGFSVKEVPTEWTDKAGSKVTKTLFRSSLTMFLSVVRLRLIYSRFYKRLTWLRPVEAWLFMKLRAPSPRRAAVTTPDHPEVAATQPLKPG